MPEELYYTVADLQYRRWVISLCIGDKGYSLCCDSKEGNKAKCGCVREFKLANAYLDVLCSYTSLACLIYNDPTISTEDLAAANCISESELDTILDWLEDYCGTCFIAKGNAPSFDPSDPDLPIGTPCSDLKLTDIVTVSTDCCLGIEDGGLVLVEDAAASECVELEETTCLLAQDEAVWIAYIKRSSRLVFP